MPINNALFPIGSYSNGGLGDTLPGLGHVLYVSSIYGKDNNDGSVNAPLKTISKAVARCNALPQNRGDTIICLPGHSESVNSTLPLVLSRIGLTIQGLGNGTRQPQLLLDTAVGSTISVTAAGTTLQNMRITANFDNITQMFTVAAQSFQLLGCRVDNGTATNASWSVVLSESAATDDLISGLVIDGCNIVGTDTTDNDTMISFLGTQARVQITNNYMRAAVNSTLPLIGCASGKNLTDCVIASNQLIRLGTSGACIINLQGTANTGMCANNVIKCAIPAIANLVAAIDVTGMGLNLNYGTGEDDKSGILIPAADAT